MSEFATQPPQPKIRSLKKVKQNFTSFVIKQFNCPFGKSQALFWDKQTPNLGLRVTANGNKSFIFEASLNNKTIRITIGNINACSIEEARNRAIKLKSLINQGIDPRELGNKTMVKMGQPITQQLHRNATSASFHSAWLEYTKAHYADKSKKKWSQLKYTQHLKIADDLQDYVAQLETLFSESPLPAKKLKLIEICDDKIYAIANIMLRSDAQHTNKIFGALNEFIKWCHKHSKYKDIISKERAKEISNTIESIQTHKKPLYLANNQIADWFAAVKKIKDPEISIYLQILLLSGRRKEEMVNLEWKNVDLLAHKLTIATSKNAKKVVPLSTYTVQLLKTIPLKKGKVFPTLSSSEEALIKAETAHESMCKKSDLNLNLDALRNSFTLFAEWVETPRGITAQIQDIDNTSPHQLIERPFQLIQQWHHKIETWILVQSKMNTPEPTNT